jgi:hypothetical protein
MQEYKRKYLLSLSSSMHEEFDPREQRLGQHLVALQVTA